MLLHTINIVSILKIRGFTPDNGTVLVVLSAYLTACVSMSVGGMLGDDDNAGCNGCYMYLCLAELRE